MRRSALPDGAFVDPHGENADAVREFVESVLDQLLSQPTSASDRSPLPIDPTVPAGEIPEHPSETPSLLNDIEAIVEGSMNPAHPGYIGHMDTMPTTISILGDLVAAAINNNMLSIEMSPVFSELEVQLIEQIAAEFGLGPDAGGVLASGGSLGARVDESECLDAGDMLDDEFGEVNLYSGWRTVYRAVGDRLCDGAPDDIGKIVIE
jgi:hypothetical protein